MAQLLRLQDAVEQKRGGNAPVDLRVHVMAGVNHDKLPSAFSAEHGRPVVFGPSDRPLWGRLHETLGPVKGAVVLCSPWGYEENCAHASFQELAREFAAAGFEALRFDYDGCGNSYGEPLDPDRLQAWTTSCELAIEFLSQRTGGVVHAVGLRLGAALAVRASARCRVGSAVLWDPVVNGKRYLRVLRAMSMMGVAAAPDPGDPGSLVTIGNPMSSATVRELENLSLASLEQAHMARALIICRPGASDPRRLEAALTRVGVAASAEDHTGTEKMLDGAAEQSVVPENLVLRIVEFIAAAAREPRSQRQAPLPDSAVMHAADGSWTEEHFAVGPQSLAAVLTQPREIRQQGVVVMTNNGVARSIGPARVWVEWGRRLASLGIASLRLDFSGLGDSGIRPGQTPGIHYPIEAIDDLQIAAQALGGRKLGPPLALGLCSGAFLNLDAVAAGAGFRAAVSINPQLFYLPDAPGSAQSKRRAAPPAHPWVQRFLENTRVGRRLAKVLPTPAWWTLARLRLLPSPIATAAAATSVAPVLLIFGEDNLGLERLRQRDPGSVRRWTKSGQMVIVDGLDHSMFDLAARQRVETLVVAFLRQHLG